MTNTQTLDVATGATRTTVAQLLPGDVIANTAGGPAFTVTGVQSLGSVFIVDFANNTATAPIPNGYVDVVRP